MVSRSIFLFFWIFKRCEVRFFTEIAILYVDCYDCRSLLEDSVAAGRQATL